MVCHPVTVVPMPEFVEPEYPLRLPTLQGAGHVASIVDAPNGVAAGIQYEALDLRDVAVRLRYIQRVVLAQRQVTPEIMMPWPGTLISLSERAAVHNERIRRLDRVQRRVLQYPGSRCLDIAP